LNVALSALVLDQDPKTAFELTRVLKHLGIRTIWTASEAHAKRLIDKNKVDGLFLDWDAADLHAESVVQHLRQSRSNTQTPVTILTSRNDSLHIARACRVGANYFLNKPLHSDILAQVLTNNTNSMQQERRRYQRVPLQTTVKCFWQHHHEEGQCLDVSENGLLCRIGYLPDLNSRIGIEMNLPGDPTKMRLEGLVAWSDKKTMVGIKFVWLPRPEVERLKNFVDSVLVASQQPLAPIFI